MGAKGRPAGYSRDEEELHSDYIYIIIVLCCEELFQNDSILMNTE
jgi:hypothetical protein